MAFIDSPDIDLQNMSFFKKCTGKLYSFLLIDTALPLKNYSCLRKNLLERI